MTGIITCISHTILRWKCTTDALTYLLWYIHSKTYITNTNTNVSFQHPSCVYVRYTQGFRDRQDRCVELCEVRVSLRVCVCVWLDKTANPQATRTQYPVSQILISCLSVAGREEKKDALRGDGGFVAPETEDTAALFEDIYGILPISPPPAFIFCRSSFIISDLIKPRRAACSAMKHLLAVCNEIVVREARWWRLITHYAKTVAISREETPRAHLSSSSVIFLSPPLFVTSMAFWHPLSSSLSPSFPYKSDTYTQHF